MQKNFLRYPTKYMNISQDYKGTYTHIDRSTGIPFDYPIDEPDIDNNRSYFYCPCNQMEVVKIYGVNNTGTNTIWLSSTNKVYLANETYEYITLMIIHPNDDTLKSIKVGDKYNLYEPIFIEGNDGNSTGYHFEITVGLGKIKDSGWIKNNKGKWVINTTKGAIKPEDAFYVDRSFTTIIDSKGLVFKELPKDEVIEENINNNQIKVLVSDLRIRKTPYINNDNIIGFAIKDSYYNIIEETYSDNYKWYKVDDNMYIADGSWLIYIPKKDNKLILIIKKILKFIKSLLAK